MLNHIIISLVKQGLEGRQFFNQIDELIKTCPLHRDWLLGVAKIQGATAIVSSGEIADYLGCIKILDEKNNPHCDFDFAGHTVAIVDDSYYSGKTYNNIKNYVEKFEKTVVLKPIVCYNGSMEKITALYSWDKIRRETEWQI